MHNQLRVLNDPSLLSDGELTAAVTALAGSARETTAALVRHLVEFEIRRLHCRAGFNSLFNYCVQMLRLSEHEAYNRIEAARVARKYPVILEMLAAGELNLTSVRLLAPHLTDANHLELLREAAGKRKQEVLELIARHAPLPDVADTVRKLPVRHEYLAEALPSPGRGQMETSSGDPGGQVEERTSAAPPKRRNPIQPLSAGRYEVRFTASVETCEKLRLAKDLLRHLNPSGDIGGIVDRALTLLLADLARKKFAATPRPRPTQPQGTGTRNIPAAVKRAVWLRDGDRCAFVSESGKRCESRTRLECHHEDPFARGGPATVENTRLLCAAHNQHKAERDFGTEFMERKRAEAKRNRKGPRRNRPHDGKAHAGSEQPDRPHTGVIGTMAGTVPGYFQQRC